MHWMRIDRYFSFRGKDGEAITKETQVMDAEAAGETIDYSNVDVVFQPMLCQHCDNAPCENVCPVAATNHSSEGLNQMAYNRCIGTRYCENNCPYKVRRFNWFDYTSTDSFSSLNEQFMDTMLAQDYMLDNMTRMVLNPDVTVRSRGVMEKCSFCVQRIQDGKLTAKKDKRTLKDGDIKTACQSSCPADAISFGNLNDDKSMVAEAWTYERMYHVLEDIHTLPSIGYLTKVRNTKA